MNNHTIEVGYKLPDVFIEARYGRNPCDIDLSESATLNACNAWGQSPLMVAAGFNEKPEIVKALIDLGSKLETQDEKGKTALMYASWFNENPAVTKELLKAGAEIETQNEDGYTPLRGAAQRNQNPEVIRALLEAGADLTAKCIQGYTALDAAVRWNPNYLAVAKVLVDSGAKVTRLMKGIIKYRNDELEAAKARFMKESEDQFWKSYKTKGGLF